MARGVVWQRNGFGNHGSGVRVSPPQKANHDWKKNEMNTQEKFKSLYNAGVDVAEDKQGELMTPKQLATYLGVSETHLQTLRYAGKGPPFRRISRKCFRYWKKEVDRWIEEVSR